MIRRLSLLAVAAVAISACGSSDALEGKDAAGVLKETFGPDHAVRSGQLGVNLRFDAKGLNGIGGPVTARISGPFQSNGGKTLPSVDLTLALNSGSDVLSAGVVSTGTKGYLKLSGRTYDVGDDFYKSLDDSYRSASAQSARQSKGGSPLSSLGIDPLRWLRSPRTAGEEDVAGTKTVHVTAGVDVARLLEDVDKLLAKAGNVAVPGTGQTVPTRLTAAQRQTITQSVKQAGFDVWAGEQDGTLRRVRADVAFAIPAASQKSVGGLQSGEIVLDLTISELNRHQDIKAPTGARPISELSSQLGGGTAGGDSPPAPSGSGSGGSGTSSKYVQCLQQAGEDLTKVQKCAALLGQ